MDDPNHLGAYRGTLSSLFNAETLRRSRSAPVGPEALMMTAEEFSDVKRGAFKGLLRWVKETERLLCISSGERCLRGLPAARQAPFLYSASRRAFFRLRLRANACLTRSFWPGFR